MAPWTIALTCLVLASTLVAMRASVAEVDAEGDVTRIIDGGTFNASPVGRVRLADADAPESGERGYDEARGFLVSLVSGVRVYLEGPADLEEPPGAPQGPATR